MEYNYLLVKTDSEVEFFIEKYELNSDQLVSQNNFILVKGSENRNKKLFSELKKSGISAYFIDEKISYNELEIGDILKGIRVERDLLYVFNKNILSVFKIGVFKVELIFEEGNIFDFSISEKYCIFYKSGYFTVLSDNLKIFNMIYNGPYSNFKIDDDYLIVDDKIFNISTGEQVEDYAKNNFIEVKGDFILHKNFTREHRNMTKYEIFEGEDFSYIKIEKTVGERKIYLLEAYDEKIYSLNLNHDYNFIFYKNFFLLSGKNRNYFYEKRNIFVLLKQFNIGESLFALNNHLLIYDMSQEILSLYEKNKHLNSVKIEGISEIKFAPNGLFFSVLIRDSIYIYDLNCNLIWKKNFTGIDKFLWQPYKLNDDLVRSEDIEKYLGSTKNENIEKQFIEPVEDMKRKWIAFLEKQKKQLL